MSFGDFTVDDLDNPTTLKVRIKASKTDPFRKGVDIYVGRTGDSLCPVSAVLSYMVAIEAKVQAHSSSFRLGHPSPE